MPGILPIGIANQLTGFFGNRIDFSNFGRTSTTKGITSYSQQQVLDRAYIWGGIIVGAAAGAILKKCLSDSKSYGPLALCMSAGVLAGFFYTHKKVMQHKLNVRNQLINEAGEIKLKIESELAKLATKFSVDADTASYLKQRIPQVIQVVSNYSMSTNDRSNATFTLFKQKNALANMLVQITAHCDADQNDVVTFWKQDDKTLLERLMSNDAAEITEAPRAKMS